MSDPLESRIPANSSTELGGESPGFWTAFRYLLDEMTESEAAAFEGRLAEEQPLRETLAEAVRLKDAIAAGAPVEVVAGPCLPATSPLPATSLPATSLPATLTPASLSVAAEASSVAVRRAGQPFSARPFSGWSGAGWLAFAAACAVLFAVLSRPFPPSNVAAPDAAVEDHLLAALLVDAADDPLPDDSSPDGASQWVAEVVAPAVDDEPSLDPDAAPISSDEPPTPDWMAPDWLIAAVAESSVGAND